MRYHGQLADCHLLVPQSDYIVGCFKLRHPEVYGIDDAGGIMFGRIGKEVLGVVFFLCEYSARASHTLAGLC
jgi:hypothetical protein